jgi:hypothetical protein
MKKPKIIYSNKNVKTTQQLIISIVKQVNSYLVMFILQIKRQNVLFIVSKYFKLAHFALIILVFSQ